MISYILASIANHGTGLVVVTDSPQIFISRITDVVKHSMVYWITFVWNASSVAIVNNKLLCSKEK